MAAAGVGGNVILCWLILLGGFGGFKFVVLLKHNRTYLDVSNNVSIHRQSPVNITENFSRVEDTLNVSSLEHDGIAENPDPPETTLRTPQAMPTLIWPMLALYAWIALVNFSAIFLCGFLAALVVIDAQQKRKRKLQKSKGDTQTKIGSAGKPKSAQVKHSKKNGPSPTSSGGADK